MVTGTQIKYRYMTTDGLDIDVESSERMWSFDI